MFSQKIKVVAIFAQIAVASTDVLYNLFRALFNVHAFRTGYDGRPQPVPAIGQEWDEPGTTVEHLAQWLAQLIIGLLP